MAELQALNESQTWKVKVSKPEKPGFGVYHGLNGP
jgi:hypothetical protein